MSTFAFQPHNLHEIDVDARRVLFHIPSSALFESDALTGALIDVLRARPRTSLAELESTLGARFSRADIANGIAELHELEIVRVVTEESDLSVTVGSCRPLAKPTRFPLTTVVLNVNTGCNLSCTYCYKEDLATPARGEKMSLATAQEAVRMLLRESPDEPRYSIVFFGGEPLTNLPLIRQVVEWTEPLIASLGKRVDFSITTNATLLDEATIDYLQAHRFGIAVSIDGPKAIHDRNRITVGGRGTYDVVARKVRLLLERYRARPVGARVTLTRGTTNVIAIWDHLFNELGFAEVGFAPVTAGDNAAFNLKEDELEAVFAGMRALGDRYVAAACEGKNIGFSNLHQLLTDIHEGTKKALPCGAGYSMVAVDKAGGVNLCHRFTGSKVSTFGDVERGLDRDALGDFLSARLDRSGTGCATCRIRNLCSGGCYHESYQRYGDPTHPVYHYCELMRDWVDFALTAYARILAVNPSFFPTHLGPRRPTS
jgi:uncharacterized protein